jgi:hypothetical protein
VRPARGTGARGGLEIAALGLALALAAPCLGHAQAPTVTLDAALQARIGIRTQALALQRKATQIDAFAKVLDPGPLAQLQSDLDTAVSAAAASKAEAARSKALHDAGGSVSSKDVEAAKAQAESDAEHVDQLRRRLGLEWGPGIARMGQAQRKALVARLARGDAALVHVDTPSNEGQDGARTVDVDIGSASAHGRVLGPARAAEPRLQSSGLIVEVDGKSAVLLSIGLTNSAHIDSTEAVRGVLLPRTAVIRFQGSDWAYVRRGPTAYERRLLNAPVAQDKGLFVASGFQSGDQVVVQGAAEVFAVERAQSTRPR